MEHQGVPDSVMEQYMDIFSQFNRLRNTIKTHVDAGVLPVELIREYIECAKKRFDELNTFIAWYPWMEYKLDNTKGPNITKEEFYRRINEVEITIECTGGSIESILIYSERDENLEIILRDLKIEYRYKNGYICAPEMDTKYTIRILEVFKKHLNLDIEIIPI